MAYTRKTRDEWEVQGDYGQGWEVVTTEINRNDARAQLKLYDVEELQYPHRIVKRRVKIQATETK